jgi:thiamine biosynthesis lipoprotein
MQPKGYLIRFCGIICAPALVVLFAFNYSHKKLNRYELSGYAQGTTWKVSYYAPDSVISKVSIDKVLVDIDNSMSLYKPNSKISEFNRSLNGVKLDKHLRKVIKKSIFIHKATGGAFDITVKPLVQAWGFGATKSKSNPDLSTINKILSCVGTGYISIRNDSLVKSKTCVEIDLNGIAQGYSVDVISKLLESAMINSYIVELGGEIRVKGRKTDGTKFKIGIETPTDSDSLTLKKTLSINKGAITTSGNYRQYKFQGNIKISHLVNPKSGYPINNEMISVTVWAKDAITADGFDNVFMSFGIKESLNYLKNRTDLAAYFIYTKADNSIADTASLQFYKFFKN